MEGVPLRLGRLTAGICVELSDGGAAGEGANSV